jgi:hypothetical protein
MDNWLEKKSNYMKTEVPDEKDTRIRPVFSVVIGLAIVGITSFVNFSVQ